MTWIICLFAVATLMIFASLSRIEQSILAAQSRLLDLSTAMEDLTRQLADIESTAPTREPK